MMEVWRYNIKSGDIWIYEPVPDMVAINTVQDLNAMPIKKDFYYWCVPVFDIKEPLLNPCFGEYKALTLKCRHCGVAVECYENYKSIKWCGCGDELRSDEDIKTKTCWICRSVGR